MKNEPGIYQIRCTVTGEKYVGSSGNLSARIKEHKYDLRHGAHDNYRLLAEWERHGEQAFEFSVLEVHQDASNLYESEQYWIDALKPELNIATDARRPAYGLKRKQETIDKQIIARQKFHAELSPERKEQIRQNIIQGRKDWWESLSEEEQQAHTRSISNKHSDEVKAKIKKTRAIQSEAQRIERESKRKEWEKGREERWADGREKLRLANTGKKRTLEQKEKLRQAALAKQQDPAYRRKHKAAVRKAMKDPEVLQRLSDAHKGKKLSQEQRAKIRKSNKGQKRSPETKRRLSEARKAWWAKRKSQD